jgi:mitochondrial import receptor subunit TOM40
MSSSLQEPRGGLSGFITDNAISSKIRDLYNAYHERREALKLPNPGTVDNIAKEVQRDVFLNNHSFTGLRADINKPSSVTPLFQVSHSLATGSQQSPPYSFGTIYGSNTVFLQGNVDSDLALSGRFNYRWNNALTTKTSVQLAGPGSSMISVDHEYSGSDFSATLKAMNPSILDGALTGIFIGSYLQSVTPRLALGMEGIWQRPAAAHGPDAFISWAARYTGKDWIASAQLLAQGGMQASYWRRLIDRVEAGVDINLQFAGLNGGAMMMGGGPTREGLATIGAKYDFRNSTYRAQVDSQGRVACLLEKRLNAGVSVTFSGEVDHSKNTTKLGLAVSLESASEELMAQSENANLDAPAVPV